MLNIDLAGLNGLWLRWAPDLGLALVGLWVG